MKLPFSRDLRQDILLRKRRALEEYHRVVNDERAKRPDNEDEDRIAAADFLVAQAREMYEQGLHHVQMSVCPFCLEGFEYSFDPFGTDGPWWQGIHGPASPACPHYCFVRGAVHFGDGPPPQVPDQGRVITGPEVPYVIPNKLEMRGMIAVIGELSMEPGWRAYPIVYFAETRPPVETLTANWTEDSYTYVLPSGRPETAYPNDPWDFELEPWKAAGKLMWCVPGSKNARLANPKGPCPYVGLPGIRADLEIEKPFGATRCGTPDGSMIIPFE